MNFEQNNNKYDLSKVKISFKKTYDYLEKLKDIYSIESKKT